MQLIELLAGLVTIIGGAYGLSKWFGHVLYKKPSSLYLKDSNIHLIFRDGSSKQITFSNSDLWPLLDKQGVIFFREYKGGHRDRSFSFYKLLSIDIKTLKEVLVTDQKPYADGLDNTYKILNPGSPILSPNRSSVLFTVEKYVTASQLVSVDINTGKWTELFSAEKLKFITAGEYKGKLLVGRSEIKDRGRDIYYSVCELDGRTLLEFPTYDSYMRFRSDALIKEA